MKRKTMIAMITTLILFGIVGCSTDSQDKLSAEEKITFDSAEEEPDTDEFVTGWLPGGVTQLTAESEPYELLQQTIADYYEIPEDYLAETRYYYNYVDLNGDGTNEVFAVIIGDFVSGSGGSSALWCREVDGNIAGIYACKYAHYHRKG